jgi:hypothetical protein
MPTPGSIPTQGYAPAPPGAITLPPKPGPARYETGKLELKETQEQERSIAGKADVAAPSAYHGKLDTLARELEAQGRLSADAAILRVLRQRLTEWVEDVRSVGGYDDLAAAVERLVQRLSAALAGGGSLASEALAVAAELQKLAAGGTPPPAPKRAFWK